MNDLIRYGLAAITLIVVAVVLAYLLPHWPWGQL